MIQHQVDLESKVDQSVVLRDSPLARWLALGLAGGAFVGAVDIMTTLASGNHGNSILGAAFVVATCSLFVGSGAAVVGGWLTLLARVQRQWSATISDRLLSACSALPLAAFLCWVPSAWVMEKWQDLGPAARGAVLIVYIALILAAWLTVSLAVRISTWAKGRKITQGIFAGGFAALAAAFYWMDKSILVGLYEQFHEGLGIAFCISTTLCIASVVAIRSQELHVSLRTPGAIWAGLAIVFGSALAFDSPAFDEDTTLVYAKIISNSREALDFDHDGASAFFGGGDCNDFSAEVGPGMFDLPGDGIDGDCDGIDPSWPEALPEANYDIPNREGYNVLFITIDAVRADHVGAYGYERATTPALDSLAQRSLIFQNAYAQASKTAMSIPSLMTGIYPGNLPRDYDHPGVRKLFRGTFHVPDEVPILAELFSRKGYHTRGLVGFSVTSGLFRGFDEMRHVKKDFAKTARAALRKTEEPFFMWTHLVAPHAPYEKHKNFDFGDEAIDVYDSELAFADHQTKSLLKILKDRRIEDRTVVVFTSDHGEAFGEHGITHHPPLLQHELLHVPLILFVPGIEPGRVDSLVELVDLAPALAESLALPATRDDFDGQSLWAKRQGKPATQQDGAYAEIFEPQGDVTKRSLFDGRWRANWDTNRASIQLLDENLPLAEQVTPPEREQKLAVELQARIASRPNRRAGMVIQRFQQSGDVVELCENLDAIQRSSVLDAALTLIQSVDKLPLATRPPLTKLLQRSTIKEPQRARVRELLNRIEPSLSRTSLRTTP